MWFTFIKDQNCAWDNIEWMIDGSFKKTKTKTFVLTNPRTEKKVIRIMKHKK